MCVMQLIYEARDYDESDMYKCLTCYSTTSEPRKFCNCCGKAVTEIKNKLQRSNSRKKLLKQRVARSSGDKPYCVTNFYWLEYWAGEFQISFRFAAHNNGKSAAHQLQHWKKEHEPSKGKFLLLKETEAAKFPVFGLSVSTVYL
jgi:hypothetical protein